MGPLTTKQRLQLFRITEDVQRSMCLDELAFITLMRICRDYAMPLYVQLSRARIGMNGCESV